MAYGLTGYIPYTGQNIGAWASGNNNFFSGVYVAIVDLDERVLANTADLLNKLGPNDPLITNLISANTTFRSQMSTSMTSLERKVDLITQALSAIRTTLNDHDSRLEDLE